LYVQNVVANVPEPSHIDHFSTPVVKLPDPTLTEVRGAAAASLSPLSGSIDLTKNSGTITKKEALGSSFGNQT
jgi:hypothetical protein